jgi:hypothetical protein
MEQTTIQEHNLHNCAGTTTFHFIGDAFFLKRSPDPLLLTVDGDVHHHDDSKAFLVPFPFNSNALELKQNVTSLIIEKSTKLLNVN